MSRWSSWMDIEENTNHECCGIYKIRLANSKRYPVAIFRFLDKDKNGILQIGRSVNIKKRIRRFRGAIGGKEYAHAEGRRLHIVKKYTNFIERHENYKIQYSFKKLLSKKKTEREEERLLKCYFKRHGEVPPLNNNLPNKDIDWGSLNCD